MIFGVFYHFKVFTALRYIYSSLHRLTPPPIFRNVKAFAEGKRERLQAVDIQIRCLRVSKEKSANILYVYQTIDTIACMSITLIEYLIFYVTDVFKILYSLLLALSILISMLISLYIVRGAKPPGGWLSDDSE
jgi:hypothetical protein